MCRVHIKDRIRAKDLMLMLGFNETMDELAMESGVHWYGHVLKRADGHALRRTLDFEVDGQWQKRRRKTTLKMEVL